MLNQSSTPLNHVINAMRFSLFMWVLKKLVLPIKHQACKYLYIILFMEFPYNLVRMIKTRKTKLTIHT